MYSDQSLFFTYLTGLQDSDDEDVEGDIDQQIESMLAPKRIVKEIKAPLGTLNPTTGATQGTWIMDIISKFPFAFLSIKIYIAWHM